MAHAKMHDPGIRIRGLLLEFGRLLRRAGLPVGPGDLALAVRALTLVDVTRRDDVYWALHAVLVRRREHRELFDAAFRWFWSAEARGQPELEALLPRLRLPAPERAAVPRRLAEAAGLVRREARPVEGVPPDRAGTWSAAEVLRHRDFEDMSMEELAAAQAAARRLSLVLSPGPTRRFRADPRGARIDLRATLRAGLRSGRGGIPLRWRSRRTAPPPVVLLCDVSGSMERYTRVLLHFAHAAGSRRRDVHVFLFGTRLTNVTRAIRDRDPDRAVARIGAAVADWGGGTRIGRSIEAFNRDWSRRLPLGRAAVLLVTDGLEREGGPGLGAAMARLRRSCGRLIWLNPLLRDPGFRPLAAGIRTMLPHVDEHLPVHDLASLEALAGTLAGLSPGRRSA